MKKSLSLFIFSAMWSCQSHAIVNIEEARISTPENGISGHADLAIAGKNGNTDKDEAGVGARLQWQQDNVTDFIILDYDYGENNDTRNTNKLFVHARHVDQYATDIAWEAFVQGEENEFARIDYRGLIGGGLRFTLAQRDDELRIYLGAGAFYVRESLAEVAGASDHGIDSFSRANIYLSYKQKLNGQLSVVSTTYYQPRLDDSDDYRALEQAALLIKMTDNLDFKLSLDVAHDSRPPQAVKKSDTSYQTGLSYRF